VKTSESKIQNRRCGSH